MDMAFFANLSKKERLGLIMATIFVSMAFLDRLVIDPVKNRLFAVNQEIKIAEKQLERNLRNINQKDLIALAYKKYIKYVKRVGSDEEEVAKILGEIEELARMSAVYLVDMKPRLPKWVDFYKEYTVEIDAEGDMESIVKFLHELYNSTQLLRAEKFRVNLKEKKSYIVKTSILITKILIP